MRKRRKRNRQVPVGAQPPPRGQQAGEAEEATQPLPTISRLVFEGFLNRYQLSLLDVAQAAGVRLLTVWRVMRDLPVSEQQAAQVYAALERLAGVPYRGRIRRHGEENVQRRGPRSSASR
jgi:hypothetical protein